MYNMFEAPTPQHRLAEVRTPDARQDWQKTHPYSRSMEAALARAITPAAEQQRIAENAILITKLTQELQTNLPSGLTQEQYTALGVSFSRSEYYLLQMSSINAIKRFISNQQNITPLYIWRIDQKVGSKWKKGAEIIYLSDTGERIVNFIPLEDEEYSTLRNIDAQNTAEFEKRRVYFLTGGEFDETVEDKVTALFKILYLALQAMHPPHKSIPAAWLQDQKKFYPYKSIPASRN